MLEATRPWWDLKREAGFRFCVRDGLVLIVAVPATWLLVGVMGPTAWALPVLLGHFFLFCNVFRTGWLDAVWVVVFLANVIGWMLLGRFSWPLVVLSTLPGTLAVILFAMIPRGYRGLGHTLWQRYHDRRGAACHKADPPWDRTADDGAPPSFLPWEHMR